MQTYLSMLIAVKFVIEATPQRISIKVQILRILSLSRAPNKGYAAQIGIDVIATKISATAKDTTK